MKRTLRNYPIIEENVISESEQTIPYEGRKSSKEKSLIKESSDAKTNKESDKEKK